MERARAGFRRMLSDLAAVLDPCDRVRRSLRTFHGVPCGSPQRRQLPTIRMWNAVLTGIPREHCTREKALPARGNGLRDFRMSLAVPRQGISAVAFGARRFFFWRQSRESAVFIIRKPHTNCGPDDFPIAGSDFAPYGTTGKSCKKLLSPSSRFRCCCWLRWRRLRPREPSRSPPNRLRPPAA